MRGAALTGAELAELTAAYFDAAARHGEAIEAANPRTANDNADAVAAVYRELRARGIESQRALVAFAGCGNDSVRLWVGSHALEFAPDLGEAVLNELAGKQGIVAFTARVTLREWRAGNLSFP